MNSASTKPTTADPAINIATLLRRIWGHVSQRRQRQFYMLIGLMAVSSVGEVITLYAVIPFIAVLSAPDRIFEFSSVQQVSSWLNITDPQALILPITLLFIGAVLFSGVVRVVQMWVNARYSYVVGHDLSMKVYERTLYQPYMVHVMRNSSEVISGVQKAKMAQKAFLQILLMLSSLVVALTIVGSLIVYNPSAAIIAAVSIGSIYGVINWIVRRRLVQNSEVVAQTVGLRHKALQEGLGGIQHVLLHKLQPFYLNMYRKSDWPFCLAQANTAFIVGCPKFIIEMFGLVIIAIFAYAWTLAEGGAAEVLPFLGMLAFAAQRLLPALQQVYNGYSTMKGTQQSLVDVLELMEQPIPDLDYVSTISRHPFAKQIEFDDVTFRYTEETDIVLHNVSFSIARGERIGLVGHTGCGKSTTVDLALGLLQATSGRILIDGTDLSGDHVYAWQQNISLVPQSIFLLDSALSENIALGVQPEAIDHERVRQSARMACIEDFINELPEGFDTPVGERGVRLSGGQCQRIGIARALYRDASVLILDEATSALDSETEQQIMDSIHTINPDITIIMIAHRVTTLQKCDRIFKFEQGRLIADGTFAEVIGEMDAAPTS